MKRIVIGGLVGLLLGVIGARYLFVSSWLSLILWAIAGMVLGFWAKRISETALAGTTYGFLLAFSFMIAGYGGAEPLATRLLPFAALGIIGAVCGTACTLTGTLLRHIIPRTKHTDTSS